MIWFGNIDSTTIAWNTVIYEFFLNLCELSIYIYGGYGSP